VQPLTFDLLTRIVMACFLDPTIHPLCMQRLFTVSKSAFVSLALVIVKSVRSIAAAVKK